LIVRIFNVFEIKYTPDPEPALEVKTTTTMTNLIKKTTHHYQQSFLRVFSCSYRQSELRNARP
jgi:hypothetical protein